MFSTIWYHLYNLKNVKNTNGGVLLTLLNGCFSRFLNCANGTKSRNASHMYQNGIPLERTQLAAVRGPSTKKFQPSASMRRAQLSDAAEVVRSTDLLNHVKTWDNTDYTRLERPSLAKLSLLE